MEYVIIIFKAVYTNMYNKQSSDLEKIWTWQEQQQQQRPG